MSFRKVFCIYLSVCLLWLSPIWAQDTILLETKGEAGDVQEYSTHNEMFMEIIADGNKSEQSTVVDLKQKHKINGVDQNGIMDISLSTFYSTISLNGGRFQKGTRPSFNFKMDRRGNIIASQPEGNTIKSIPFPNKPLKIGDSWVGTESLIEEYPSAVQTKLTLIGIENVNGYPCAVIESSMKAIPQEKPQEEFEIVELTARGKMLFDYTRGIIVKMEVNSRMVLRAKVAPDKSALPDNPYVRADEPKRQTMKSITNGKMTLELIKTYKEKVKKGRRRHRR